MLSFVLKKNWGKIPVVGGLSGMLGYDGTLDYGPCNFFFFSQGREVLVGSCVTFSDMWRLLVWEFFDVGVNTKNVVINDIIIV